MKLLITGGAGFIGSHLADRRLDAGGPRRGAGRLQRLLRSPPQARQRRAASGQRALPPRRGRHPRPRASSSACSPKSASTRSSIWPPAQACARPSTQPVLYEEVNCVATAAPAGGRGRRRASRGSCSPRPRRSTGSTPSCPSPRTIRSIGRSRPTPRRSAPASCTCSPRTTSTGCPPRACASSPSTDRGSGPRWRSRASSAASRRDEPIPFYGDGGSRRDYTFIDDIVDGVEAALGRRLPLRDRQPRGRPSRHADGARRGARGGDRQAGACSTAQPEQPGDVPVTFAAVEKAQTGAGLSGAACRWQEGCGGRSSGIGNRTQSAGRIEQDPMNICMVGTGYVGLVTGACLADFGMNVVCVDKDAEKIAALAARRDPDLRARPRRPRGPQRASRTPSLHDRPEDVDRELARDLHRGRHAPQAPTARRI